MRARRTLAALLGLLVAAALGAPGAAGAEPVLRKCDIGTAKPYRCGHIRVPAVRSDPSLGTVKVAFAVRPRGDRTRPSRGSIVFVEGGPGFAATNFDSARSFAAVFAPFLERRELVLIDQRGTGRSGPLLCGGLQKHRTPSIVAAAECAAKLGPRYQGYTSAESAADVEAVRQALGLRNVILYGDSYGTLLGQAYAVRYGRHLDSLILSSAYPANDPFWRTLYPAGVRALRLQCRRSTDCRGDAAARFRKVARRLKEDDPRKLDDLLTYLLEFGGTWAPASYRYLNNAVSHFLHGNPRPLRELTASAPPGDGDVSYFSTGMGVAVECNDYPVPWDGAAPFDERVRQMDARIAAFRPRGLFAPLSPREWMLSPAADLTTCLGWPGPTPSMEPPVPSGAKMPAGLRTLVLAGEFDDITTVEEARQVARRFPSSTLRIIRNRGHASELYFPFKSRATRVIRNFVRGQR